MQKKLIIYYKEIIMNTVKFRTLLKPTVPNRTEPYFD